MGSTEKELYDTFLNEAAASSAHIECTVTEGPDGEITVSASGHRAVLFCCACEILKQLAQRESQEFDGQKLYLAVVCREVLEELEQEAEHEA